MPRYVAFNRIIVEQYHRLAICVLVGGGKQACYWVLVWFQDMLSLYVIVSLYHRLAICVKLSKTISSVQFELVEIQTQNSTTSHLMESVLIYIKAAFLETINLTMIITDTGSRDSLYPSSVMFFCTKSSKA